MIGARVLRISEYEIGKALSKLRALIYKKSKRAINY